MEQEPLPVRQENNDLLILPIKSLSMMNAFWLIVLVLLLTSLNFLEVYISETGKKLKDDIKQTKKKPQNTKVNKIILHNINL